MSSPGCSSVFSQSIDLPSILGGVPVFIRPLSKPISSSWPVNPTAALSALLPPPNCLSPICMSPLRKVPFVSTTVFAGISRPSCVLTPTTLFSLTTKLVIISCQKSTLGICSRCNLQSSAKRIRSLWARGLHMAGPLDRLSMRNWIMVLSVTIPEYPPSASISRTNCPLATPPMAGLQDICAMVFIFMVASITRIPILAAAAAASHPACPAPTTTTSYSGNIFSFIYC